MDLPFDKELPYFEPITQQPLLEYIGALLNTEGSDIKIKILATKDGFEGTLEHDIFGIFSLHYLHKNTSSFHFSLRNRRAEGISYNCDFLVYRQPALPNIALIISDCERRTFKRLCQYLRANMGTVSELGIDQDTFQDLFVRFRDSCQGFEVRVRKVVEKAYSFRKLKDKPHTEISWGLYEIEEVFERARELNLWFKSASYTVRQPSALHRPIRGSVSRDGYFLVTSMFNTTYQGFILPFCRKLQSRYEFLLNRARLKKDGFQPKPVRIDFYDDIFEMPECNSEVINLFHKYKNASVSVMHGNPYIHLSIVDFWDGSSYDILVVDRHSVTIVPQLRATPRALHRICQYIWDNINEGIFRE